MGQQSKGYQQDGQSVCKEVTVCQAPYLSFQSVQFSSQPLDLAQEVRDIPLLVTDFLLLLLCTLDQGLNLKVGKVL